MPFWRSGRRIVYNTAKRPVAVYAGDQPIARYHYNSQGERIAKTVFAPRPPLTAVSYAHAQAQGNTTYTLYRDQRLAAETDSEGQITAHYIYLYGKPVAKVEMTANESWLHRVCKSVTMQTGTQAGDTQASVYAIVGDHLGTPQQVFDGRQRLIWQADTGAYGQARVTLAAASGANGGRFVMNLRLPGQIFDAEIGLHYNYQCYLHVDYVTRSNGSVDWRHLNGSVNNVCHARPREAELVSMDEPPSAYRACPQELGP